jgi:hypothetical protein
VFCQAVNGIKGVRDYLQGEPLLDCRCCFVNGDDLCRLVRLQNTGGTESNVSIVIRAEVYATATAGIVFTIVETGAICVDSDGAGIESYSLDVVALCWDSSKTFWVCEDAETFC